MTTNGVPHPPIVSRRQWLNERKKLLAHEKELTKQYDRVNAERQQDFEDSPPEWPQKPTYG